MSTRTKVTAADPSIVPVEGPIQGWAGAQKQIPRTAPRAPENREKSNSARDSARDDNEGRSGAATASPYGVNNEHLPERLQEALRRLVLQFSTESELSRRQEIRRIKQAHQFWRGLQYLWWDERDQNWHLPFEQKLVDGSSLEDMPRYEFVTNIYQAFGLSLISVLSQDVPRVRFFPSSAQAEEDVAAAKAATEVAGLVERNNRIGNLIVEEAFNLWTDGKVGAYVRFVVDGQRFGFHPETEIAAREVKLGDDVYVCPDCGAETPCGGFVGAQHAVPACPAGRPGAASRPSDDVRGDAAANGAAHPRRCHPDRGPTFGPTRDLLLALATPCKSRSLELRPATPKTGGTATARGTPLGMTALRSMAAVLLPPTPHTLHPKLSPARNAARCSPRKISSRRKRSRCLRLTRGCACRMGRR